MWRIANWQERNIDDLIVVNAKREPVGSGAENWSNIAGAEQTNVVHIPLQPNQNAMFQLVRE